MGQKEEKKAERKAADYMAGSELHWERLKSNRELQADIRSLQIRWNMPFPDNFTMAQWIKWIDSDLDRFSRFSKDVDQMVEKYSVPKVWRSDIEYLIRAGKNGWHTVPMGTPKSRFSIDPKTREQKIEIIITPETDLTNPLVIFIIQQMQKNFTGDPPKPICDQNNPRKSDWRPVYEWHKYHPLFTEEEIAEKIGYAPQTVRHKFADLEKSSK